MFSYPWSCWCSWSTISDFTWPRFSMLNHTHWPKPLLLVTETWETPFLKAKLIQTKFKKMMLKSISTCVLEKLNQKVNMELPWSEVQELDRTVITSQKQVLNNVNRTFAHLIQVSLTKNTLSIKWLCFKTQTWWVECSSKTFKVSLILWCSLVLVIFLVDSLFVSSHSLSGRISRLWLNKV